MMYVVGGVDENEIMLYNVILALRDSLHLLFKYVFPSPLSPPIQEEIVLGRMFDIVGGC